MSWTGRQAPHGGFRLLGPINESELKDWMQFLALDPSVRGEA